MKSRLINSAAEKTYVVVFEEGDEPVRGLLQFAGQKGLGASRFTSIGGFSEVTLGYFDLEKKNYIPIRLREQVEVVALTGNISLDDGKPKVHAHVVVAKRDGTAHGGHFLEARVCPTLEVLLVESPEDLVRTTDRKTVLALLRV
jgi:uncharacterized protein